LADALSTALGLPPPAPALVVAGRTDAGVHALAQVCHVDLPAAPVTRSPRGFDGIAARLAALTPDDLRVRRVRPAPPGFDARFSALRREYRYLLCDDPSGVPPLRRHDVVPHIRPLAVARMTEASVTLLGLRDFAAFCRRREAPAGTASTVRTLEEFSWTRDTDGLVRARVVADAFCHSMVRALVGCLLPVGDGRRPADWPAQVLAGRRRDSGVTVAPARGLALVGVEYPPPEQLSVRAREARSVRDAVAG
jgi:tRNA pseudouridine38-40 synthase